MLRCCSCLLVCVFVLCCGVVWCECKIIYRTEVQYLVMGFVQIANCGSKYVIVMLTLANITN